MNVADGSKRVFSFESESKTAELETRIGQRFDAERAGSF